MLCLDDVGWHDGRDLRYIGQASRSGLPRDHAPDDYIILGALGKAIDMKILCPLCLGDWDKDNFLRGALGVTHDPHNWDRAAEIDLEYSKRCFDALESAHIEYAVHGLMHGRYDENGGLIWEREYFVPKKDKESGKMLSVLDLDNFKRRLDLFFKIYDSWGFSQKIRTFVCPCGLHGVSEEDVTKMTAELYSRGIRYAANGTKVFDEPMKVYSGIGYVKKCGNAKGGHSVPWEAYDVDPNYLCDFNSESENNMPKSNVIGMHLTNFIRYNPENNMQRLDDWIAYFKRQSEVFGIMIAKDIAFSVNQQFYHMYAKLNETENGCEIDLGEVARRRIEPHENVFYVSLKKGVCPTECDGGKIEKYDEHAEFVTYRVCYDKEKITLTFSHN